MAGLALDLDVHQPVDSQYTRKHCLLTCNLVAR